MTPRPAQSPLELYEELVAAGWPEAELARARRGAQLASRVFATRVRASGKPFVCHVVGVASLALAHGAERESVLAALLHSADTHADFGGASEPERRALVRAALGPEAEARVAAYATFPFRARDVRALQVRLERGGKLAPPEHELVLLHLVNALEDLLHGGEALARPGAPSPLGELGPDAGVLVDLAHRLPAPALAEALEAGLRALREQPRRTALVARWAPRIAPRRPRARVLLFRDRAGPGGAVRLMALLAERLPVHGPDVLLALAGRRREAAISWLHREGLAPEPLALPEGALARCLALRRHLRTRHIDVLSTHSEPRLGEVLAARLAGAACVLSPHAIHAPRGPERLAWWLAFRLCRAIVVADERIEAHLRRHGAPAARLRRIASGIATPPEPPPRSEARRRLGLDEDAVVVLCAARLQRAKGVDTLIEAVARVPDPEGRLRLLVAGDGPQRASLERLVRERLGHRGRLLGFVEDPTLLYAAADLFALASRSEGGPFAIREAAAHGLPSVAFDVGAVRVVLRPEETGLLVPPEGPQALAEAIERLVRDPALRARLGRGALAWARAAPSADAMARGYAELLEEVAAERTRPA